MKKPFIFKSHEPFYLRIPVLANDVALYLNDVFVCELPSHYDYDFHCHTYSKIVCDEIIEVYPNSILGEDYFDGQRNKGDASDYMVSLIPLSETATVNIGNYGYTYSFYGNPIEEVISWGNILKHTRGLLAKTNRLVIPEDSPVFETSHSLFSDSRNISKAIEKWDLSTIKINDEMFEFCELCNLDFTEFKLHEDSSIAYFFGGSFIYNVVLEGFERYPDSDTALADAIFIKIENGIPIKILDDNGDHTLFFKNFSTSNRPP